MVIAVCGHTEAYCNDYHRPAPTSGVPCNRRSDRIRNGNAVRFRRDPTAEEETELRRMGARPVDEGRPSTPAEVLTRATMDDPETTR